MSGGGDSETMQPVGEHGDGAFEEGEEEEENGAVAVKSTGGGDCSSNNSSSSGGKWVELMGREVRYRVLRRPQPLAEVGAMGTIVTCRLRTYYYAPPPPPSDGAAEGGASSSSSTRVFVEASDFEQFKIGEGDAVPGLELCLRHSKPGDELLVRCSARFAWGLQGRKAPAAAAASTASSGGSSGGGTDGGGGIPAGADVEFEAEVLSHAADLLDPKLAAEAAEAAPVLTVVSAGTEATTSASSPPAAASVLMGTEELVHYVDVQLRRTSGNRWYRWGDFARAGRCYSKAAEAAEKMIFPPQPDAAAIVESGGRVLQEAPKERKVNRRWLDLYVASINNLAATHLQNGDPLKAREACIKGLEVAPDNVTTLLRAGRASLQLHEYNEASVCFKRVLEVDPGNKAVVADIAKLRRAVEQYKTNRKAMSNRMVSKLFTAKDGAGASNSTSSSEGVDENHGDGEGREINGSQATAQGAAELLGAAASVQMRDVDSTPPLQHTVEEEEEEEDGAEIESLCASEGLTAGTRASPGYGIAKGVAMGARESRGGDASAKGAAAAAEADKDVAARSGKATEKGDRSSSKRKEKTLAEEKEGGDAAVSRSELRRLAVLGAGVLGFALGVAVMRM